MGGRGAGLKDHIWVTVQNVSRLLTRIVVAFPDFSLVQSLGSCKFKVILVGCFHFLYEDEDNNVQPHTCQYNLLNVEPLNYLEWGRGVNRYLIVILFCGIAITSGVRVFSWVPVLKLPHFGSMFH